MLQRKHVFPMLGKHAKLQGCLKRGSAARDVLIPASQLAGRLPSFWERLSSGSEEKWQNVVFSDFISLFILSLGTICLTSRKRGN
jgi:hypothetical protein